MNSSLNYHASQARIDDMIRQSAQLQGVERQSKIRARVAGLFASRSPQSRPEPTLRPSSAPVTHKA